MAMNVSHIKASDGQVHGPNLNPESDPQVLFAPTKIFLSSKTSSTTLFLLETRSRLVQVDAEMNVAVEIVKSLEHVQDRQLAQR